MGYIAGTLFGWESMARYANIVVEPPGPRARKVVEQDRRYIATTTKTSPVVAESASGGVVRDVDGNDLLDFASGIAVMNVGHSHPRVVKAVQEQAERLFHFAGTNSTTPRRSTWPVVWQAPFPVNAREGVLQQQRHGASRPP